MTYTGEMSYPIFYWLTETVPHWNRYFRWADDGLEEAGEIPKDQYRWRVRDGLHIQIVVQDNTVTVFRVVHNGKAVTMDSRCWPTAKRTVPPPMVDSKTSPDAREGVANASDEEKDKTTHKTVLNKLKGFFDRRKK